MVRHLIAGIVLLASSVALCSDHSIRDYRKKPDAWFATDEGKRITANVLSWQSALGGWPKNVDTANAPYAGTDREKDLKPTFDNDATTHELTFLARAFNATHDAAVKSAVERGFDHILKAQYPTGGWPQSYPPDKSYHRYITFNDNAMGQLLGFIRETYTARHFAFLSDERKAAAKSAFDRGVECILKCQIKVDGKLTAWCAQHDEKDYSPREGRKFELVSLSGAESVGITRLLMSLDHPSTEIQQAIESAVEWFRAAKLTGVRVNQVPDDKAPKGLNKVVVNDPTAPPIWARFYEIGTNKPIFSDRDSVKKYSIAEIGYERRCGYSWHGDWPAALLDKDYPAWKAKLTASPTK